MLKVAYTHRLDTNDLADLRGVASCAHQLQHWIDKTHEARVVIVGNRMFAVTIHAGSPRSRVDWRTDFDALRYELVQMPVEVERGLSQYMETFGLVYAACDFCIDRDGRWLFLESNSSGQYAWLEAATGAPISAALADLLAKGEVDARLAGSGRVSR
ncbi:MAG TPA: hypothetical protein VGH89_25260 [Pseudonocardia sp.]